MRKEQDINNVPVNLYKYIDRVVHHVGRQDDPTKTKLGQVLMYEFGGDMLRFKAEMTLAVLCKHQSHAAPTCGELNKEISTWADNPGIPI